MLLPVHAAAARCCTLLTAHYVADPPAEEFMEAADELGMFVELESECSLPYVRLSRACLGKSPFSVGGFPSL